MFVVRMVKYLMGILFSISMLSLLDNIRDCYACGLITEATVSQKNIVSYKFSTAIFPDKVLCDANTDTFSFQKLGLFDSRLYGVVFPAYFYSRKVEYPTISKFTASSSRLLSVCNFSVGGAKAIDFQSSVIQKLSYRYFVYVLKHILI